jgi:hypothetical protein
MNCGDFVSYWGSIASLIGIPLTLVTILLAKSISDHIQDSRFSKRVTNLVAKLRESQKSGKTEHIRVDLKIFMEAIEINYNWPQIFFLKRVRKLYFTVRKQHKAEEPNIRLIEGLLLNFKTIHSEVQE